jgi:glutaredoxin
MLKLPQHDSDRVESKLFHLPAFSLKLAAIALLAIASGCSAAKVEQTTSSMMSPATASTSAKAALASHLTQSGAKLYSVYWCPYCKRQKEMFGEAASKLPLIECDPKGQNPQTALCTRANIQSFPTWEIQGKFYRGMMPLEDLAALSEFKGPRNFDN